MSANSPFQNFQHIFHRLDFKSGDHARSVYSPAAYLADLLDLLHHHFDDTRNGAQSLSARRDDIERLLLDHANTFSELPYLEIVNKVLEKQIGGDVYAGLRRAEYPFNMPFNLHNERRKNFAGKLGTDAVEIYRTFAQTIDFDIVAREYLGLSEEEYALITTPATTDAAAKLFFQLGADDDWRRLGSVDVFLARTGMTRAALRELLLQHLSETAVDAHNDKERGQAVAFFINHGLEGYVTFGLDQTGSDDGAESALVWSVPSASIPFQWYERVNRFVRSANRFGLSFTDLDLILRRCCDNRLDTAAIRTIAAVKHMHTTTALPIDVICALLTGIDTLGVGDDDAPADLFNRTFNERWAALDKRFIAASPFKHPAYQKYQALVCLGDVLAADNRDYRRRLTRVLDISEPDLRTVVTRLRDRYAERRLPGVLAVDHAMDLKALSLLFRITTLANAMETTYIELFTLLELIEKDSWIRRYNNFDILIGGSPRNSDPFAALEEADAQEMLWLVPLLLSLNQWMKANDIRPVELNRILTGRSADAGEKVRTSQADIVALDNLYQRFEPTGLHSQIFVSPRFSKRAARVIHRVVTDARAGLAAASDPRIVSFDSDRAVAAAYQAVSQFDVIAKEDFTGLGLESRLVEKTFANLIRLGYLNEDGELIESALPAKPGELPLATDFSAHREALFALLNSRVAQILGDETDVPMIGTDEVSDANNQSAGAESLPFGDEFELTDSSYDTSAEFSDGVDDTALADVSMAPANLAELLQRGNAGIDAEALADVSFYPDDLAVLADLADQQRAELYDNLIYNGYVTADGNVLHAAFFAQPDSVRDFIVNVDLSRVAPGIDALLRARIRAFDESALVLDESFAAEPESDIADTSELIENLRFNGYLDGDNCFIDKRALLNTDANRFDLAQPFLSQRGRILHALQEQISNFRAQIYRIDSNALTPVAEAVITEDLLDALHASYLKDNRVKPEYEAYFSDPENVNSFRLTEELGIPEHAQVFDRVAGALVDAAPYRVTRDMTDAFYFDQYETSELMQLLGSMGLITRERMVPASKLPYFLNDHNNLKFSLWRFEDYNRDVFDTLRVAAIATDAAIGRITATLKAQCDTQRRVVIEGLAEGLGVDADLAAVLSGEMFGGPDHVVEEVMAPILALARQGRVTALSASKRFNAAYRRMSQFALLANKLGLNAVDAQVVLRDQALVQKFPEPLNLPDGVDRFDALLEAPSGEITVFRGNRFWIYSAATRVLLHPAGHPLSDLSGRLADVSKIDAAFVDPAGTAYLVTSRGTFRREHGRTAWLHEDRKWGKVKNRFSDAKRLDSVFHDRSGKTYLFAGDQYIRYSGSDYGGPVDEGYPRTIAGNWEKEDRYGRLPDAFRTGVDASFDGTDGRTYFFRKHQFVSSDDFAALREIKSAWGRVKNNFSETARIDAAYVDGADTYMLCGDQIIAYRDGIENDRVHIKEGYPKRLESHFAGLPPGFDSGLDAAFKGVDGNVYLFKNGKFVTVASGATSAPIAVKKDWGIVKNRIAKDGRIDAAFVGLDGKTYLFSGDQYVRYSGADYTRVDEGFPRLIDGDWGGLHSVDAAFVLNGKTYLFGSKAHGESVYVRYSKRDYAVHDEGYPKPPNDNWWNLPASLVGTNRAFATIDAVFTGKDNLTYLFSGGQFIRYDNKNRWWSEPQDLKTAWDSLPFDAVDAAFVGTDGKTYFFGGEKYVRYSSSSYSRVDDRYPCPIKTHWGHVVNNIQLTGTVDAAIVVDTHELIDGAAKTSTHTYLFSGNQYVRYSGKDYKAVDNGYPRYIATSLKKEPRFKNLLSGCESGIDAAFADRRQVYLFKGAHYQVLSDTLYREYSLAGIEPPRCAVIEKGTLFLQDPQGWRRCSALEGASIETRALTPALLRRVPAQFQSGLDAILQGSDQNVYLFKGSECFNVAAGKSYPLAEEWGRVRNNVYLQNSIDAAFVGTDGKTYLFCGDQFVVYSGTRYHSAGDEALPNPIEGPPRLITDHWGGLSHIALAYVKDEQTFLFEKPDSSGSFRYVRYSSADYSKPDAGFPKTADESFWTIPPAYRQQGFSQVKAVLFKGETMFLLSADQYIQLDELTQVWSYPRPIGRIWREFPWDDHEFRRVKTAFTGADGVIYFFAENHYIGYSSAGLQQRDGKPRRLINEFWGVSYNNFVGHKDNQPTDRGRVDAAFVYGEKVTYLFSGDQYLRYSSPDYRFADEGYPKAVIGNLIREPAFGNLPASFDDLLRTRREQGGDTALIDAVVSNRRHIYLFVDGRCHVVSQTAAAQIDIGTLGRVRNNIADSNRVDASFVGHKNAQGDAPTFLFSDDQYVRYSTHDYSFVDEGYPRAIREAFADEEFSDNDTGALRKYITALPDRFNDSIDAAMVGADGRLYLFKDDTFFVADPTAASTAQPINQVWGKVANAFNAAGTVTAAFIAPRGGLYAFSGSQYVRYESPDQEFVDEGYPKSLKDNWGNLPVEFEHGIDGAFVFDRKTYFVKGDQHVRFTDTHYRRIDSIYPQSFRDRWTDHADFLLTDIKTIARFKELQNVYGGADRNLTEILHAAGKTIQDPYAALAQGFGWDVDELKWLKRCNAFLGQFNPLEVEFHLELVIRIFEVFTTARKVGTTPSSLWENVFQKLYPHVDDEAFRQARLSEFAQPQAAVPATDPLAAAADALYRYLALKHSEKDWAILAKQIQGELNEAKRDALIAVVLAHNPDLSDASDFYQRFLIDAETDRSAITSPIQEAIAAVQLYIHRYLMSLESPATRNGNDDEIQKELSGAWKWLRNYRLWEANRKVFLYPENYLRPELRDTKTPAFKVLEDDLLQGELTQANVQQAYKKYLDEYTEVSRLTIAGGYVFPGPIDAEDGRRLVLFGRTKTDPRRYYYREARLGKRGSDQWEPWLKVNVQIDADSVYPVHAFGRVFVFWTKVEVIAEPAGSTTLSTTAKDDKGNQTVSSNTPQKYAVRVYYSFYNLNKEWVAPQVLNITIQEVMPVADVRLLVRNAKTLTSGGQKSEHDNILINCSYRAGVINRYVSVNLTPELYANRSTHSSFSNRGERVLASIVDESGVQLGAGSGLVGFGMVPGNVVMLNGADFGTREYWFAFDYKGGSFLCKPSIDPLPESVWPNDRSARPGMPQRPIIHAAIRQHMPRPADPNGAVADKDTRTYFFSDTQFAAADYGNEAAWKPTRQYWGLKRNNIASRGVVDAALTRAGKLYLFSGDQYLRYSDTTDLADADAPKALNEFIRDELGGLDPFALWLGPWTRISAAFTAPDGRTTYFFNRDTKQFIAAAVAGVTGPQTVQSKWGKSRTSRSVAPVTKAFFKIDRTGTDKSADPYLIFGNQVARFKQPAGVPLSSEQLITGFPRPKTDEDAEFAAIAEIDKIDPSRLDRLFYSEGHIYVKYKDEPDHKKYLVADRKGANDAFTKWFHEGTLTAATMNESYLLAFSKGVDGGKPVDRVRAYRFSDKTWLDARVEIKNVEKIDQALFGRDAAVYLFSGRDYMKIDESSFTGSKKAIEWAPSGDFGTDLLGELPNNIAATGIVDGAWVSGNHTYLFSGDQYVRYTGTSYDIIDEGYPKPIKSNSETLPKWDRLGSGITHPGGKTFFFSHDGTRYVEAGQMDNLLSSATGWGKVANEFTLTGRVDSAYWQGQALYLTSGTDLIRYTLSNGALPEDFATTTLYIDPGYPKTIVLDLNRTDKRINAAFTLSKDGPRYFISGHEYYQLPADQEPTLLEGAHALTGSWIGMPDELETGVDGVLENQGTLFFFKGTRYAAYPRAGSRTSSDNTTPIADSWKVTDLYEIAEASYDLIRLSSSTAFKLNQALFTDGVPGLLSLSIQRTAELPAFSRTLRDATTIRVGRRVDGIPESDHLDFASANGLYYWEIFFHAPYLIAQTFNTAQKFDEAKQWYEFIFDPTARHDAAPQTGPDAKPIAEKAYWQFLPFRTAANEPLAESIASHAQLATSAADPFDPHAIAALRNTAYRKAIVMAYVDNLLDWGDLLFRQFTRESINEARMLYVLAYDLLGKKPEHVGRKVLSSSRAYRDLGRLTGPAGEPRPFDMLHSIEDPYFFVPENAEFADYWTRVQDRLYKIRHSLNILGINQPLPLFEPPIDPMAIVRAVGAGASLDSIAGAASVAVPHHRFSYMLRKAQELVQAINTLGGELLAALEKKDVENLSQLQNRQEGEILKLTRLIKEVQLSTASETVQELEASLRAAKERERHYGRLIESGLMPTEQAQIALMATSAALHMTSAGLKAVTGVAFIPPKPMVGPFIMGVQADPGQALQQFAEVPASVAEGLSMIGEVLGVVAQHDRSTQDWSLQQRTAQHEIEQLGYRLNGARLQEKAAQRELDILDRQTADNGAIATFMRSKFSNAQLYQWMTGKLTGLYYQGYALAYDMAKAAEKAFQFERAAAQSEVSYIQPLYWESQKHGLLAGISLGQDLARMEKAFVEDDRRGFEITKKLSLLRFDPVALLQLKTKRLCEFALTEALFDYDFPGHYGRQIRTVAVTFAAGSDGRRLPVNAVLTQLSHKTVLAPDIKAVKYLMDPKDAPPLSLRSDWRNNQQIVLSEIEDHEVNNGLFELRYDDERYLPFEGTGAVSHWRLQLSGKSADYALDDLQDVIVTVKYTAEQGGDAFATAVKALLKPYERARFFDVARDFPEAWQAFVDGQSDELALTLNREHFPHMHGSRLSGVFTHFDLAEPGEVSAVLNGSDALILREGQYLPTPGLTVGKHGSQWALRAQGERDKLVNVGLVVTYTAKAA